VTFRIGDPAHFSLVLEILFSI